MLVRGHALTLIVRAVGRSTLGDISGVIGPVSSGPLFARHAHAFTSRYLAARATPKSPLGDIR